jgi:hypothetical protein
MSALRRRNIYSGQGLREMVPRADAGAYAD